MGEIDMKPFWSTCKERFKTSKAEVEAFELYMLQNFILSVTLYIYYKFLE